MTRNQGPDWTVPMVDTLVVVEEHPLPGLTTTERIHHG